MRLGVERRKLIAGISGVLFIYGVLFMSGSIPESSENGVFSQALDADKNVRDVSAEIEHDSDDQDANLTAIEPVTVDSEQVYHLTQCTENEKAFRGSFRQNLRKLKSLLFPEADKWINKLGLNKHRPPKIRSFPVFVTAATTDYFDISQGLIKSVHELLMPKYPTLKFIYFDLSLRKDQRNRLERHCRCEVRDLPAVYKLPAHARIWKTYTFKPVIVSLLFHEFGHVWWLDSSVRFTTDDLDGSLQYLKKTGSLFFTYANRLSVAKHTRIATFNYFKEHPCPYGEYGEIEAGNVAFYDNEVSRTIIKNWVSCALIQNCMAPPGSILSCIVHTTIVGSCHRYDQSVLSIILRRLYHKQNDYPLVPKPFRIIKVMRGHRVKYFPP